jgi:hypothetical protein
MRVSSSVPKVIQQLLTSSSSSSCHRYLPRYLSFNITLCVCVCVCVSIQWSMFFLSYVYSLYFCDYCILSKHLILYMYGFVVLPIQPLLYLYVHCASPSPDVQWQSLLVWAPFLPIHPSFPFAWWVSWVQFQPNYFYPRCQTPNKCKYSIFCSQHGAKLLLFCVKISY